MTSLYIDIQGYQLPNKEFLLKELATFDGTHLSHFIFKSPFPLQSLSKEFQKTTHWLIKHHHGIRWDVGFVYLHEVGDILRKICDKYTDIYVKGVEKKVFIEKYVDMVPVYELPLQPIIEKSTPMCSFHSHNYCICALTNVIDFYNWSNKNM